MVIPGGRWRRERSFAEIQSQRSIQVQPYTYYEYGVPQVLCMMNGSAVTSSTGFFSGGHTAKQMITSRLRRPDDLASCWILLAFSASAGSRKSVKWRCGLIGNRLERTPVSRKPPRTSMPRTASPGPRCSAPGSHPRFACGVYTSATPFIPSQRTTILASFPQHLP